MIRLCVGIVLTKLPSFVSVFLTVFIRRCIGTFSASKSSSLPPHAHDPKCLANFLPLDFPGDRDDALLEDLLDAFDDALLEDLLLFSGQSTGG